MVGSLSLPFFLNSYTENRCILPESVHSSPPPCWFGRALWMWLVPISVRDYFIPEMISFSMSRE